MRGSIRMFSFYGGKHTLAKRLGPPEHPHVIEPFAGSAGYSSYWNPPKVTLVEIDPVIWGTWNWLKHVKESEILSIPVNINHVDELGSKWSQEVRWLVGWWMNIGCNGPSKTRSNWGRKKQFVGNGSGIWSATTRTAIASQLKFIRHWTIIHGSYEKAPDITGHWHIDPPYDGAGSHYKFNKIDYEALGKWCLSRKGFVQVCENSGATWLPFKPFAVIKGTRGRNRKGFSDEALFELGSRRLSLFNGVNNHDQPKQGRTRTAQRHRTKVPQQRPTSQSSGADRSRQRLKGRGLARA